MKKLLPFIFYCCSCFGHEAYYSSIIQQVMKEYEVPGIAVALYFNGQGNLDAYGVADLATGRQISPDTIFEIASITKVFTSSAIAVEVLQGKMHLNESVTAYLPKRNYKNLTYVTIESLATHTSSIQRSPPILKNAHRHTYETIFHFLEQWNSPYPVSSKYLYSNLGYGILGYTLATVEKKPFMAVIHELILKPLEMNSTDVQVPPYLQKHYAQGYKPDGSLAHRMALSALPASGALRSTASDMLKFLAANLDIYGPKELRAAMQFAQQEFYRVNPTFAMGLGWQRFHHDQLLIIDKNGGLPGFSSYIGMISDQKIGIVLLANKSKVPLTRIGRRILSNLSLQLHRFHN